MSLVRFLSVLSLLSVHGVVVLPLDQSHGISSFMDKQQEYEKDHGHLFRRLLQTREFVLSYRFINQTGVSFNIPRESQVEDCSLIF